MRGLSAGEITANHKWTLANIADMPGMCVFSKMWWVWGFFLNTVWVLQGYLTDLFL